jgi:hypothetical protein
MPTVAELRDRLRGLGLPTSGNKATLTARLERALHQDYFEQGEDLVIGVPQERETGTCPNSSDPIDLEEFELGDVVRRLRNTNFTKGLCYRDRTLKQYIETTQRGDGPNAEDMGSLQWPTHSATWHVPGNGDTVVRKRWGGIERMNLSQVAGDREVAAVFVVSATTVPRGAFRGCPNLKTVSLSDTVMRIEEEAFDEYTGSLIIPPGIRFIGHNALDTVGVIRYHGPLTGNLVEVTDTNWDGYANKTAAVVAKLGVRTSKRAKDLPMDVLRSEQQFSSFFNADNVNDLFILRGTSADYREAGPSLSRLLILEQELPPLLIIAHLPISISSGSVPASIQRKRQAQNFHHLIELGADVTASDEDGRTALHYISGMVDNAVSSERYLHHNSWTSALGGPTFELMVTPLILNGADVWQKDRFGKTPLDVVCEAYWREDDLKKQVFMKYTSLFMAIWYCKGTAVGKYNSLYEASRDLPERLTSSTDMNLFSGFSAIDIFINERLEGRDPTMFEWPEDFAKAVVAMLVGPWSPGTANVRDTDAEREAHIQFPTRGLFDGYLFEAAYGRYYTYDGSRWHRS